jgi:hypothetical protein
MLARIVGHVAWLSMLFGIAGSLAAEPWTPPNSDAFLRTIKTYPFAAPAARREKIRAGVPLLTRCMPAVEVRKIIGDPDFGYHTYKGGVTAMNWNYVLEKKALKEVDSSSRVVTWFDADGKLQGVTIYGAPDIEHNISRRVQACSKA